MNATPAEVDAELAKHYTVTKTAEARIERSADALYRFAGDRGRQVSRNRKVYTLTLEEAEAKTREIAAANNHYDATQARYVINAIDKARADIAAAEEASRPLEAEFVARRWTRFFLVTSSNGHIHRSMSCSTCNLRTGFGWLPQLSGKTDADAVADQGALLCTVCFPDAPVHWTNGRDAKVDEDQCAGSGTFDYPRETARLGYMSGNYGVCRHCDTRITVSSTGKMRKHKP